METSRVKSGDKNEKKSNGEKKEKATDVISTTPGATVPASSTASSPAVPAVASTSTGRGRKALDMMTPEQLAEWKATHPSFMELVNYDGGKPNLEKSVELFKAAFSSYIAYRPTPVAVSAKSSAPALDAETLKKVEKYATDAFGKRAVTPAEGGPRQVKTEAFVMFICQSLGIDPFEMEEKRKSVLRALTNSLGYEKVKVMVTEGENKGTYIAATGKHAALYLASEAVKAS